MLGPILKLPRLSQVLRCAKAYGEGGIRKNHYQKFHAKVATLTYIRKNLWHPNSRPKILQRLWLKTSPIKPIHRMRSHIHKPHTKQQTTLHIRRRKPIKRLHPRKRHSKSKPKSPRTQQRRLPGHKHRNRKTNRNKRSSPNTNKTL